MPARSREHPAQDRRVVNQTAELSRAVRGGLCVSGKGLFIDEIFRSLVARQVLVHPIVAVQPLTAAHGGGAGICHGQHGGYWGVTSNIDRQHSISSKSVRQNRPPVVLIGYVWAGFFASVSRPAAAKTSWITTDPAGCTSATWNYCFYNYWIQEQIRYSLLWD